MKSLSDLFLPLAIMSVVGMMIFPLPIFILDTLLAVNITFAIALLISTVYLAEPERFTALPSILLLTTLFRLGLNVSTTRQLLGTGEAPEVVQAFGTFVAGGNLIVGVVVFVIVTLVQFLVIAKGAERVAEVAARFTLDAMPGKQMAIDADVRAGLLGLTEAKQKRIELQREAKLYGALDGAMKFVKGDAIAGLIITVINITAGLFVGISQYHLPIAEAFQRFTIFTIGDGLVSQIPALLIAVGAGIAVTRVSDKDQTFMGQDVIAQLTKEPQAVTATGLILVCLAFVPELPSMFFLGAGAVFLYTGRKLANQEAIKKRQDEPEFRPKVISPLGLRLSPITASAIQKEQTLIGKVQDLRKRMFELYGIVTTDIQFEIDTKYAGSFAEITIHGSRAWIWQDDVARQSTTSVTDYVLSGFEFALRDRMEDIMNDTHTRMLLEVHSPVAEDIINSVIPDKISVTGLTKILRQLVKEGVSIRDLPAVLQAISEYVVTAEGGSLTGSVVHSYNVPNRSNGVEGVATTRLRDMLSVVRIGLKRSISRSVFVDSAISGVWVLAPSIEHLLARIGVAGAPILSGVAERIINAVKEIGIDGDYGNFVIVTSKEARAELFEMLCLEFEGIKVIAVDEIMSDVKFEVLGQIGNGIEIKRETSESNIDNVVAFSRPISLDMRTAGSECVGVC